MTAVNASTIETDQAVGDVACSTGGMCKKHAIAAWSATVVVAGVFLAFGPLAKLTGSAESVALFERVGLGTAGMYAVGVGELLALILILIPKTAWLGAAMAAGAMVGAIGSHLFTPLGVSPELVVNGEAFSPGPVLFVAAVLALGASLVVLFLRRKQIPVVGPKLP